MALKIITQYTTGSTLRATIQQLAGAGPGDIWDASQNQWVASSPQPTFADVSVPLTEGAGYYLQRYFGEITATLGTYSGVVAINIHDDNLANNQTVGIEQASLLAGVEITNATVAGTALSANVLHPKRVWFLRDGGEYETALEEIRVSQDSTVTVGMDFTSRLNPQTDLTGSPAAVVSEVQSGLAPGLSNIEFSADRKRVHVDVVAAVAGVYKFKFTASTTDSNTFVGYGIMRVT